MRHYVVASLYYSEERSLFSYKNARAALLRLNAGRQKIGKFDKNVVQVWSSRFKAALTLPTETHTGQT